MSLLHNAASPPSRPPSSASSSGSVGGTLHNVSSTTQATTTLARVHHDHTRPLPPPRIVPASSSLVGSSPTPPPPPSPRPPFSTSSTQTFRSVSRTPLLDSAILSATTTATTTTTRSGVAAGVPGAAASTTTSEVSLTTPRPDGERVANEYVETPFRPQQPEHQQQGNNRTEETVDGHIKASNHQRVCGKDGGQRRPFKTGGGAASFARVHRQHQRNAAAAAAAAAGHNNNGPAGESLVSPRNYHHHRTAVTKQPVSFTKEPAHGAAAGRLAEAAAGPLDSPSGPISIICEYCGKCRCEMCRDQPSLPSRWLCDNTCFCSAETALDYASCLCCVKGLFYHCGDNAGQHANAGPPAEAVAEELAREGNSCADDPCSCTGSHSMARWSCLGALSLALPCLFCYWPLKGCVSLVEKCWMKYARQGCRCDPMTRHHQQLAGLSPSPSESTGTTSPGGASPVTEALMRDSRDTEKRLLDPIGADL